MSWLYSRALVEASLGVNCLDGAQFALWSGISMPPQSLLNDKTRGTWRHFRYGMMFKRLMDDHGEAVLTSFLAVFPAKILALPGKAQALTEKKAVCGGTWRELLVKFDRVSHSWKTHRHLFDEDLPESSVILPKSGMTVDGVLWGRTTSARRTVESESGFWPTPVASRGDYQNSHGKKVSKLSGAVKWSTPTVNDAKNSTLPASQKSRNSIAGELIRGGIKTQQMGLNPNWVEWLMGWPIGWTDLKPLETGKFQRWRQQHF